MSDARVSMTPSGPPETVLAPEDPEATSRLEAALSIADRDTSRAAVAAVVADYPTSLDGWASLGDLARDPIEAYAAYRVGYHRGLDRLRQSGWRGSGYVRWAHDTNRGFLRALSGLERAAAAINERDEQERCAIFLMQLDPDWPPADFR